MDSARAVRDAIDSYPSLSAELFGVIRASTLDGMRLDDLTYADGTLSIAGTASRIDDTAAYVARLRTSGVFPGGRLYRLCPAGRYRGTESYQFQITALLKGREGLPMASKLNRREKTLLYLLLCLAITAGTVCLLILPAVSRNAEMRDALDAAETQKDGDGNRRNTLEKDPCPDRGAGKKRATPYTRGCSSKGSPANCTTPI